MQPSIEPGDLFEYKDPHPSNVWDVESNSGKECSILSSGDYFVVLGCEYKALMEFKMPVAKILIQKNGVIGTFVDWHKQVDKK